MIDLLLGLQETHGLSYLFISHDLRVVRALADEIIVMRSGRVVEQGAANQVFTTPENDYTRSLIKAAMEFEVWNDAALSQ
jgi:microcin C transport system ATP-binding protein